MSALGVLPPVDAAIHADTTWERTETYEFAQRWTPWLEERGVKVVTVQSHKTDVFTMREIMLPTHNAYDNGEASGTGHRQCTNHWKIRPIRRWAQQHRDRQPVDQWLGITLDEIQRVKPANVKYITNEYPFLDMTPPMRRGDVIRWLGDNGLEVPVKSSCIFCPYHDRNTWREVQLSGNGDWTKVLEVDEAIRHKRPGYTCYLTAARKPLNEIDFRTQEEHGQLGLWEQAECSGMCFL